MSARCTIVTLKDTGTAAGRGAHHGCGRFESGTTQRKDTPPRETREGRNALLFERPTRSGNRVTVSGTVTNIGERASDEVVNLNDTSEAAGVDVDLAQRHRERG